MKVGVADYGMDVWEGARFDTEERLARVKGIGYEGLERCEAVSEADALHKAARFRRLGMDFATCRGPDIETSILWTAALGKPYVWVDVGGDVGGKDFDTFCRQVSLQVAHCARWGLRVGLHNHLGSPVESPEELGEFMARCPQCGLILDTAHLAAAGGDPVAMVHKYADRLVSLHLKDWMVLRPELGLERWTERGRFCGLGAGNVGLDNAAVVRALGEVGYHGWAFVEQDTHIEGAYEELAASREYLREAGV